MGENIFLFIVSLVLVVKGATLATKYAANFAKSFKLSKYVVGFIIVAVISLLPETLIGINSALEGVPSFGLGTLFGSNVADLTLVFAGIILFSGRKLKIESRILKHHAIYPFLLMMPIVLGWDGYFSRGEGIALILGGAAFYYLSFKNGGEEKLIESDDSRWINFLLLTFGVALLLLGTHFTVTSAVALANQLGIAPFVIGMLVVGLGTTIPEFFFSLKAVKKSDDSLAVGDILGTVLADATVVVGLIAFITPFSFPQRIIYMTAVFMVIAAFVLFHLMRSGKVISKKEAYVLIVYWVIFFLTEFFANK